MNGDKLVHTFENNQSQIMFLNRAQTIEQLLRNNAMSTHKNVLDKYPPIYAHNTDQMINRIRYPASDYVSSKNRHR